jgi:hypothetical protein
VPTREVANRVFEKFLAGYHVEDQTFDSWGAAEMFFANAGFVVECKLVPASDPSLASHPPERGRRRLAGEPESERLLVPQREPARNMGDEKGHRGRDA